MIPHHSGEGEAEAQRRTDKVANHGKRKRAAYCFLYLSFDPGIKCRHISVAYLRYLSRLVSSVSCLSRVKFVV
jgi:hypothetical protein